MKSALTPIFGLLLAANVTAQSTTPLRIYLDADQTRAYASGNAIERGIRTALSEVDYRIAGREVEVVVRDHRSSTPRSTRHFREFADDERGLVIFGGMHSPPLLENLPMIHERGLPTLVPWAAAGPVTRYDSDTNWVFRLSIDDSKAGYVIARHAIEERCAKAPALVLEDTGWGKSNQHTMTKALTELGAEPVAVRWFKWGMQPATARRLLRELGDVGADMILLVSNAPEAKALVLEMVKLPESERIPINSHWGFTGRDFAETVSFADREACGLQFIQTRFSFRDQREGSKGYEVLQRVIETYDDVEGADDIKAPAGLVHAYDLTKILIAACASLDLDPDITVARRQVRDALEVVETPVEGLLRTYQRPFRRFHAGDPDAHEALSIDDLVMARYLENGAIQLQRAEATPPR